MINENELRQSLKGLRSKTTRAGHNGDYRSKDENERLTAMFYDGVGISEMAVLLQRTEPAVMQQIEKLDLYMRKSKPSRRKNSYRNAGCKCPSCPVRYKNCKLLKGRLDEREDM